MRHSAQRLESIPVIYDRSITVGTPATADKPATIPTPRSVAKWNGIRGLVGATLADGPFVTQASSEQVGSFRAEHPERYSAIEASTQQMLGNMGLLTAAELAALPEVHEAGFDLQAYSTGKDTFFAEA